MLRRLSLPIGIFGWLEESQLFDAHASHEGKRRESYLRTFPNQQSSAAQKMRYREAKRIIGSATQ
jgi:hypothetical protein